MRTIVSKLFRAYELYNRPMEEIEDWSNQFQSSFELTSYITIADMRTKAINLEVSKLFRAYELYNILVEVESLIMTTFQSSFELTSYITPGEGWINAVTSISFKALSSLRVI